MADPTLALTRRGFFTRGLRSAAGLARGLGAAAESEPGRVDQPVKIPRFGVVTGEWTGDWDLPTLIRNTQRGGAAGVELHHDHPHGVTRELSARRRQEVRLRFENASVRLVGLTTRWTPERQEAMQEELRLSADVGGSGVTLRPEGSTDEELAHLPASLEALGRAATDLGQELRLEIGETRSPATRAIIAASGVSLCWRPPSGNLPGERLVQEFELTRGLLGRTVYVGGFDDADESYQDLMDLLVGARYDGWVLLEARSEPRDRVQALVEQRAAFGRMIGRATARARG